MNLAFMDKGYTTEDILDITSRAETLDEYKDILLRLDNQKSSWRKIIAKIIVNNGYTYAEFG